MVKLSFGFLPIYLPAVAELGELALLPLNGGVAGMRSLESQSGRVLSLTYHRQCRPTDISTIQGFP